MCGDTGRGEIIYIHLSDIPRCFDIYRSKITEKVDIKWCNFAFSALKHLVMCSVEGECQEIDCDEENNKKIYVWEYLLQCISL